MSRTSYLALISILSLSAPASCGDDKSEAKDSQGTTDTARDSDAAPDTSDVATTDVTTTEVSVTETVDSAETSPEVDVAEVTNVEGRLDFVDLANPVDITPDGTKAIIWDSFTASGDVWLYDVGTRKATLETSVGSPARDFPTGLSADLKISALYGEPVHAGLWDGTGWRRLGSLFDDGCGLDPNDTTLGDIASAWDISADGVVVVGLVWKGCTTVAFRWSEVGGERDFRALQVLGGVPEGSSSTPVNRATVVSDDGLFAAGFAQTAKVDRWPAIWRTDDATGELLKTTAFPDDAPGEILAIETDGSFASGVWNQHGFVWSKADGVTDIGALPDVLPGENTVANAIAGNGTLVFGASGGPFLGTPRAFVWTKDAGMRKLEDVVKASGITLPAGTILTNVLAASTDGAVLIGTSMDENTFVSRTFVLQLPAAAYRE